jgi:hypothetical protein
MTSDVNLTAVPNVNPISPYNEVEFGKHVEECTRNEEPMDDETLWYDDEEYGVVLFRVCANCGVQTTGLFQVLDFANHEYVATP